jgi:hypothetical protein
MNEEQNIVILVEPNKRSKYVQGQDLAAVLQLL